MTDLLSDVEAERLADEVIGGIHPIPTIKLAHKVKQLLSRQRSMKKKLLNDGYFPCELCGEWLGRLAMQVHQCPQEETPPPEPPKQEGI